MNTYKIDQIAELLNGELIKGSGGKVNYLLIDSRKVLYPRESLFFALSGSRHDGHRFIGDLYEAGVRNFVVEQWPKELENYPRANFVKVKSSFQALQYLVAWHRSQVKVPTVGVTGSNGKTILKEWIYQCVSSEKIAVRNPKSYNSQVGVPLSVWLLHSKADLGIFEAGISKPGEMENLEKIVKPNIGIFTNIGDAHQENFETLEQKVQEKIKLFTHSEIIIYCKDHDLIAAAIEQACSPEQNLFTWGTMQGSNLWLKKVKSQGMQTLLLANFRGTDYEVNIPFIDKASIENVMHLWSTLIVLGWSHDKISLQLEQLENVGMRLELKEGINNCTIINDSYNSDLESLKIALDFLSFQNQHPQRLLILSDIEQSGYSGKELYSQVAGMIQQKKVDRLIGIGPAMTSFAELFMLRKDFYKNTEEFLANFPLKKLHDSTILIKGARKFAFEQVSKLLQKQNHRTVFEIDLNAIEYNLNYFRSKLKVSTGIIAMVKAFSYGSGTHELANLLQFQNVQALAVAFPDEGFALRENGIKLPIMVLNSESISFPQFMEFKLEPSIINLSALRQFNQVLQNSGIKSYPVHIKLDTGMHRSGFLKEEIPALIHELKACEHLKVKTIFSHLASADEPEQDDFTLEQIQLFDELSQQIMAHFTYKIRRHILNSAGIERFTKYQFDMVRLGIGMYGLSVDKAPLIQVGALKSNVAQIKKVKAGKSVGYSQKGKVNQDSYIATIPIGYADGLRRSMGNGVGQVWINGQLVPIIGNVCMDMCMVDVTNIKVEEGDAVEIFGKHISIETVAAQMQTIPYEVLTGISQRVKRTYHVE